MYKWTLAVQIHVVQGSTVYSQSHTTITSIMLFRSREREGSTYSIFLSRLLELQSDTCVFNHSVVFNSLQPHGL